MIVKTDFETDGSFSALLQTPRPGLVARPPGGSRVPPVAVSTSTQQQRCSSEPDNMNIVKVCHAHIQHRIISFVNFYSHSFKYSLSVEDDRTESRSNAMQCC